ncbi:hypothetical protein [Halodesulfovibrio sp.]|jgi:hypothetical protein|uniref:hypothetical protein n=1 Tax=Halodesulfovibrio sp. TaxID=1912772 RepID=UPI0025DEA51E|nr:hypothetical protein [Halodesulfovibrio sp.]MCT4626007.1 hypothetical protein [Halodesulfovibrio sp.]
MNYQKAESLTGLFWQKTRNPLTFWPRVILTLLIFIAFWSQSAWWIIFLFFVEAGVLFFAPPATDYESWVTRATDGFRIWSVIRSVEERNVMLLMFLFPMVAFLTALWSHSIFWLLFFGVQLTIGKLLLIKRFQALAKIVEYDVQVGLTEDDLQGAASRCGWRN